MRERVSILVPCLQKIEKKHPEANYLHVLVRNFFLNLNSVVLTLTSLQEIEPSVASTKLPDPGEHITPFVIDDNTKKCFPIPVHKLNFTAPWVVGFVGGVSETSTLVVPANHCVALEL